MYSLSATEDQISFKRQKLNLICMLLMFMNRVFYINNIGFSF